MIPQRKAKCYLFLKMKKNQQNKLNQRQHDWLSPAGILYVSFWHYAVHKTPVGTHAAFARAGKW